MDKNKLPTRNQLAFQELYGTPEQSEAAKILLATGFYREPTVAEAQVDDHWHVMQCRRIATMSPEEYQADHERGLKEITDLGIDISSEEIGYPINDPQGAAPDGSTLENPALVAHAHEPEVNAILARLNLPKQPQPLLRYEEEPKRDSFNPQWTVAKPTPSDDWGNGQPPMT